jgi:hypothetical protein
LGYVHPDYLLAELTSVQLSEWQAYDKLDPIGRWRDDFHTAQLSSLIINIVNALYHDPKQGKPKDTIPMDFMPMWDNESAEIRNTVQEIQTSEQMRETVLEIARIQNLKVEREKMKRTTPPLNVKK